MKMRRTKSTSPRVKKTMRKAVKRIAMIPIGLLKRNQVSFSDIFIILCDAVSVILDYGSVAFLISSSYGV